MNVHFPEAELKSATQAQTLTLIANYFLLEPRRVGIGCRLVEDLGADSLEILEITHALNDLFGIELPEDELSSVRTAGDLCRLVDKFF